MTEPPNNGYYLEEVFKNGLVNTKVLGFTLSCSAVCALSSSRTMDWLPASTASSSGIFPLWNDAMSRISFFHSFCLARSLFSSMKLMSIFCWSLTCRVAGGLRPSHERDPGFALFGGSLPPSAIPSRRGHSTRTLAKHEQLARSAPCYCTNTLRPMTPQTISDYVQSSKCTIDRMPCHTVFSMRI